MTDRYRMTPGVDTVLYGHQLTDGMKVLLEFWPMRHHGDAARGDEFFKITRLDVADSKIMRFVAEYDDGYLHSETFAKSWAWIVRLDSIEPGHPYAPKVRTVRPPLDMNPVIRAQWATALRSGDYPQTRGILRRTKEYGARPVGYCCLGVLCDLAVKAGIITTSEDGDYMTYDHADTSLPMSVRDWASLTDADPVVAGNELSRWNDTERKTFGEIADLIEGRA